jgi:hypothetical protein
MSNFKVGEKVVCIDSRVNDYRFIELGLIYPIKNEIYTIRKIFTSISGNVTFYLEEIINVPMNTVAGFIEVGFKSSRFRKLDHQFGEDVIADIIKKVKQEELTLSN